MFKPYGCEKFFFSQNNNLATILAASRLTPQAINNIRSACSFISSEELASKSQW